MLCQRCQKRVAQLHFSKIIDNQNIEIHLCEYCANEASGFSIGVPINIGDFIAGMMGISSNPYTGMVYRNVMCEKCGMSYLEFEKTGKLGCGNCYNIFGDRLKYVIKRLQGATDHVGKVPERIYGNIRLSKEIEKLKEELNKLVANEEYERAALIRDQIKHIESEGKSIENDKEYFF
jgi:protein arginine kinase activator